MTAYTTPELPRLIVNGSGKYKYVFTYKNHWVDGRSVRGKGDTRSVGKFVPDENDKDKGEIFFNEEFVAKYPALEHFRVFRYKGGRLEFKPIDEDDNLQRPQSVMKLHAGATWALFKMIKDTPLERALARVFPEHRADLRLLSLAFFLVLQKDSSLSATTKSLPNARGYRTRAAEPAAPSVAFLANSTETRQSVSSRPCRKNGAGWGQNS